MRTRLLCMIGVLALLIASAAIAQTEQPEQTGQSTGLQAISGEVVSHTGVSLVIRTDAGKEMTFVIGRDTEAPETIAKGSGVRVEYEAAEDGKLHAVNVTLNSPSRESATESAPGFENGNGGAALEDGQSNGELQEAELPAEPEPAQPEQPESEQQPPSQQGQQERPGEEAQREGTEMPNTAGPLPLLAVSGLLALGGGLGLRRFRRS